MGVETGGSLMAGTDIELSPQAASKRPSPLITSNRHGIGEQALFVLCMCISSSIAKILEAESRSASGLQALGWATGWL